MSGERGRTRISADATGPARRYARQTILPDFGAESVDRLGSAHAAVVGAGALGSMSSQLLARAGVGTITLIDRDVVDWTNLQRQVLYTEADAEAGVAKATAAAAALRAINSSIAVRAFASEAEYGSIERLLELGESSHGVEGTESEPERGDDSIPAIESAGGVDVIVDGTDNFETRMLLNDVAVKHGVPLVHGGAIGTRGMVMTVLPAGNGERGPYAGHEGPCLRCVLGDEAGFEGVETCDTAGVLGSVTAAVASFQATETLKILLGRFEKLRRHLLVFDPWETEFARIDAGPGRQSSACACCGDRRFEHLEGRHAREATRLCGSAEGGGAVQLRGRGAVDLSEVARRFRAAGLAGVAGNAVFVRGRVEERSAGDRKDGSGPRAVEVTVFADGRAIFRGLNEPDRARALYARYVSG